MATHFSILAWRIPWTEEPGGLQSIQLQSRTHLRDECAHTYTPRGRWNDDVIFLTSINKSLNSVDPSFLLNSLLLKPFLEHACTPSLKFPNFAIRGDTALGKGL